MLQGSIDVADRNHVSGWVRDPAAAHAPVYLLITSGDQLLQRIVANRHRADVEQAGFGRGRHGFDVVFDPPLSPGRSWVIHVRSETDAQDVPGSPLRIAGEAAFDKPTQDAFANLLGSYGSPADLDERLGFINAQRDRLLQMQADLRSRRLARVQQTSQGTQATRDPALPCRALVIDAQLPDPNRDAGSQALMSHMRSLRRLGFEVSFACPALDGGKLATALEGDGIAVYTAPGSASVEEILRREAGGFDLVYLHRGPVAAAYLGLVRMNQPRAWVVYSVADLHHLRRARQADIENRPEIMADALRLRADELWAAGAADAVITHSAVEAGLLHQLLPAATIRTIPWDVPVQPCAVAFEQRAGLAFIGNYRHEPNADAARRLRDDIMPLVWSVDPAIQCLLVGDELPPSLLQAHPGMLALGHVPDLASLFSRVRLTVAPLSYGAGLKGKVLDSLAAGIPCVCSPIAAEGLDLPERLKPLVAVDLEHAAKLILRLHTDPAFNERLAKRGLAYVRQTYAGSRLDQLLAGAMRPV